MRHKWLRLMFSGVAMLSMMSCSSAQFSPSATSVIPLPDTPVDKPAAISPAVTEAVEPSLPEASIRPGIAVPITRTQPDVAQEPITSTLPISVPLDPALQKAVIQAKGDLARRLGVPADSITIDAVIGQEFSTDAFYCRTSKDRIARDESLQVMSGQSILLSASAHRYEYHASGQTVVFCRPLL